MIKTGYSFKIAIGHIPEVLSRIKEIGLECAPIADHLSTFGFRRWRDACEKANMRPVFGVQLPVSPNPLAKRPVVDHWQFYAKTDIKAIHELVWLATSRNNPSLTYEEACNAEGVFKIAGHQAVLDQMIKPNDMFIPKDLFIGLSPAMPLGLYKQIKELGYRFVATSCNLYPRQEDEEFYRVAIGKRSNTQLYPQWILTDGEWRDACYFVDDETKVSAIANRDSILERCNAKLQSAELLRPDWGNATLRGLCEQGADDLGVDLSDNVYADRLERELDLILNKGFADYFYLVSDMIKFAKLKMCVGPGRGSSAGSLVCYLLGITTIDPLQYNLLFERFIDANRSDLPDIDSDFSDERRNLVFEYMAEKYGRERAARLGTVGYFQPRSAMNQIGTVLKIPKWQIDEMLDSVVERSSGDSRAMLKIKDTLETTPAGIKMLKEHPYLSEIAPRMEGHPNNASQHAAGLLLTQEPIRNYVAIDQRTHAAMVDKKDAAVLNLLKIDVLGLTQLSIFERCFDLIGIEDGNKYLRDLPLDDDAAFKILSDNKYAGVFQFQGKAVRTLAKQIAVDRLDDIIALGALARPGPMASGAASKWAKRRMGQEQITTPHAALTEVTKDTYGVIVYQEQVLIIVREIGDMSWDDANSIRKAMSGTLGEEYFSRFGDRFIEGAMRKHGMTIEEATSVWKGIATLGNWAFNKSHAVSYGLVSYYCAYLKAHYPLQFAAATLDAEAIPIRQIQLLRELKGEGIGYLPFDIDISCEKWAIDDEKKLLIGPLTVARGIGPVTMKKILDSRENGDGYDITKLRAKTLNIKTDIDSLYPITDRIKTLYPDLAKINIISSPVPINTIQPGDFGRNEDIMIIGVLTKIGEQDMNEEIRVQRRGNRLTGKTMTLNMFCRDDNDEIFCKINRFLFDELSPKILNRGGVGKVIYAIKGTVPNNFRMIDVKMMRFIGYLKEDITEGETRTQDGGEAGIQPGGE